MTPRKAVAPQEPADEQAPEVALEQPETQGETAEATEPPSLFSLGNPTDRVYGADERPQSDVVPETPAPQGLYALGNPMDRVHPAGAPAPKRVIPPDPDGSAPGFVGVRPGDEVHTYHDGTTELLSRNEEN